jgi:hypothetical protein
MVLERGLPFVFSAACRLIKLEDCLADLSLVEQVVVLDGVFNRDGLVDKVLEQLFVLQKDLECGL